MSFKRAANVAYKSVGEIVTMKYRSSEILEDILFTENKALLKAMGASDQDISGIIEISTRQRGVICSWKKSLKR